MTVRNVATSDTLEGLRTTFNSLGSDVGSLTSLGTTDKTSIVAAINEVNTAVTTAKLASNAVDAVLGWLNLRGSVYRIEITVHPRNQAGLVTAERICQRWNGQIIDEFIGIELNDKTVPHRIHVIDLPRM